MTLPMLSLKWTPVLALGLIVIGGVTYYWPEETRQFAMDTATRVSTTAVECWEAAGWREIGQSPTTPTTRGYRAPQRFAKPSQELAEISARQDRAIHPASHDDSVKGNSGKLEFAQEQDQSQRPQATAPLLAPPGNAPKLRQLGGATAPKLKPTHPATQATKSPAPPSSPTNDSALKNSLNAPEARKLKNPYAIKTSDDGEAPSQNENAMLQEESGPEAAPQQSPVPIANDENPIGSGVALEKLAQQHTLVPQENSETKGERSVLKRRSDSSSPNESSTPSTADSTDPKQRRRPFTAILLDAAPGSAPRELTSPSAGDAASKSKPPSPIGAESMVLKPNELLDHHASNFHGVTPGATDEKAAIAALGTPTSTVADGNQRILRFNSESFKQVEVCIVGGKVDSVTLVMHKALPTKDIVKELGLSPFEPALVTSPDGFVLGQVYPERGVILEFAQAENGSAEVDQIVLDQVKAEPFLIRALDDKSHRYTSAFRDLEIALKLDPQEARALWLKANLLCELGRYVAALRAVDDAIRIDSLSPGNHLTRAKILLAIGRHSEASRIVGAILAQHELPPQAKARAICLQGELQSSGPNPNFEQSLESFRSAIREASALADDTRPSVRRLARRVLIESHLGVARSIAWGQLEDAEKASTQWHERARLLAETAIGDEDVGDDIWLAVHRSAMTTHLGLMAKSNPDRDVSELKLDQKRLVRAGADPLYRERVKWELALALTDASRIESARGKHSPAGSLADSAWLLMSEGVRGREANEQDDFARGMLLYQLGSIAAIAKEDHAKAVGWYGQAIPLLEKPLPESLASQNGIRGLSLVGMGASYWEAGDKQQAITLADLGAKTLQEAAKSGHASREALSLAWGNLESMYREIGDQSAADRVARMGANLENPTQLR